MSSTPGLFHHHLHVGEGVHVCTCLYLNICMWVIRMFEFVCLMCECFSMCIVCVCVCVFSVCLFIRMCVFVCTLHYCLGTIQGWQQQQCEGSEWGTTCLHLQKPKCSTEHALPRHRWHHHQER